MTHSPTSTQSFESIEQLDEMLHAMGWPTEYRQLRPGSFSSTWTVLESDSWFLMEEQSSRRVEIQAPAPSGMYVLALLEGEPGVINGQAMSSDHIFVQSPDSEFRATLPAGIKAPQIGIAADQFEDVIRAVAPDLSTRLQGAFTIATAPGRLEKMRRAMCAVLAAPSTRKATNEEAILNTLADLVTVAADHGKAPFGRSLHRVKAQRALNRAREYIEDHLDKTIRIASLCQHAGANIRTLERIFTREVGMTPNQYVKARRLNAVRRTLLLSDMEQGIRVTDVALSYGFAHLGRFAAEYHRYFGEYPRETLQNR